MTKEEAHVVIENCKGWNVGQQSMSNHPETRQAEDAIHAARRAALAKAWTVVGAA